jgi:hypothetical protein
VFSKFVKVALLEKGFYTCVIVACLKCVLWMLGSFNEEKEAREDR